MGKFDGWVHTERATIANAKERLACRIADLPIWVRWYRTSYGGNTGTPWGVVAEYGTYRLVGVTAKRLKLQDYTSGVYYADPNRCYFATRKPKEATR